MTCRTVREASAKRSHFRLLEMAWMRKMEPAWGMALQKADLRATPFQSIPLYESFIFIYEKPDLKFSRHNSFCLLYVIPCQH